MEQTKSASLNRYEVTAHVIGLPFRALHEAGKMAAATFSKRLSVASAPAETKPAPATKVEPSPAVLRDRFQPADRVHSQMFGNQQVHFYQYSQQKVITAKARSAGHVKEFTFSPEVAAKHSLPFSIDGAVRFVRDHGLNHKVAEPPKPVAANAAPVKSKTAAPAAITSPAVADSKIAPAKSARPFEGEIMSFGPAERNGDRGPYQTYVMQLNHSLIGERDFIGEQLAELVVQHELQVGQMVRLHPLGKRPFVVVENGKDQHRHRNEYSIELL